MKRTGRKVLAYLLTVSMIVTYMPSTAVALEGVPDDSGGSVAAASAQPATPAPAPAPQDTSAQKSADPPAADPTPPSGDNAGTSEPAPSTATDAGEGGAKDTGGDTAAPAEDPAKTPAEDSSVTEENKDAEKTAEQTEEEKLQPVHLTQSSGGTTVTVDAAAGVLPNDAKLKVTALSAKGLAPYVATVEKSLKGYELVNPVAVDITIVDKSGKVLQPSGKVDLTISNGAISSKAKVYHFTNSSNYTAVSAHYAGGMKMSVSHFSVFLVASMKAITTETKEKDTKKTTEKKQTASPVMMKTATRPRSLP